MKFRCFIILIALCTSIKGSAQGLSDIFKVQNIIDDAVLYSDKYLTPATSGAVYLASTSWMSSAKKKKLWELKLGIHNNTFIVPNKDRSFNYSNNQFKFFKLESGASSNDLPTALGNGDQVYLYGEFFGNNLRVKTPKGINQEVVNYPYLHVELGLPYGFELITRTSTVTNLKNGYYQVYGYGLKHNLSQYFSSFEKKSINLAVMSMYSREEIGIDFLDIPSNIGNFGLNKLTSKVNTYHFQISASKSTKRFEFLGSIIGNYSKFDYSVFALPDTETTFLPVEQLFNTQINKIEEPQINILGEFSVNVSLDKFSIISSFAFGEFINANLGVQYKVN